MAAVHGVGPVTALIGGVITFAGVNGWLRFSTGGDAESESRAIRAVARFNRHAVKVMKPLTWLGLVVGVVGLLIWAAS